jgi:hypothetical protein
MSAYFRAIVRTQMMVDGLQGYGETPKWEWVEEVYAEFNLGNSGRLHVRDILFPNENYFPACGSIVMTDSEFASWITISGTDDFRAGLAKRYINALIVQLSDELYSKDKEEEYYTKLEILVTWA